MRNRSRMRSRSRSGGDRYILPSANLVDNWDASIASSITVATGVSSWASQVVGGHALVQATGADQPVYDSATNSITFDGVSDFLRTAAFTLNQPETVYIVCHQVSWGTNQYLFDGIPNDTGLLYQNATTPGLKAYAGALSTQDNNLAIGKDGVVAVVFNGASSSLKVDNNAAVTGNFGATNMGGFTLAGPGLGGLNTSHIMVHEVAIYSAAHDAATQASIIAGLMTKWGVA